jgi:HPt (histidine-containing phosphotransfer) domain-containing protein
MLKDILEASYKGNIGFMEMVQLYQKATPKEVEEIEEIIRKNDWDEYKRIVKRILGINLK